MLDADHIVGIVALLVVGPVLLILIFALYRGATAGDRTDHMRVQLAIEEERTKQAKIWSEKTRPKECFCPNCGSVALTSKPKKKDQNEQA